MHIGIILDGNRRYAKKRLLEPWKGHEMGADKIEKLCEWCKELSVNEITLYAFSTENFKRDDKEVFFLMNIFKKECRRILESKRVKDEKLCVRFIGRRELFDDELRNLMDEVEKSTDENETFKLNLAIGYGGRQEIVDGVKKVIELSKKGMIDEKDVDVDNFKSYLYLNSEPDMIIRTGGEKRLSNFLTWQSAYSELIFLDKMWPEFEKEDLIYSLDEYKQRERRFGK